MKSTFKVLFYLKKGSEKRNGEVTIMARITVDGKICQFSTKQSIHPDNWSVKAGKATGKSCAQLNKLLEDIKASLHQIYHEQQRRENYVTAEQIKNEFLGHTENHEMLLNLFQKHNDDVKQLIGLSKSASTYQKYEVTRKHLANFIQAKYNLSDIALKSINNMFINDFEVYLMTVGRCNHNTTAKFMQFFKRIVLIARNNGLIVGDPFANYKIRLQRVDRGYLTEEEIKKILELNLVSLEREGFSFSRADSLYGHNILEDIWIAINESSLIIADITSRNPNVFYEIGIAHTLGKKVILLTQKVTDIPFDFKNYRHIIYEDNVDGFNILNVELPNYLK